MYNYAWGVFAANTDYPCLTRKEFEGIDYDTSAKPGDPVIVNMFGIPVKATNGMTSIEFTSAVSSFNRNAKHVNNNWVTWFG